MELLTSAEDNLIFYIAELASPFPERRALLLCLCVIMKRIFIFLLMSGLESIVYR